MTSPSPSPAEPFCKGRIVKWTDDRGFGFILPEGGGDTIFIHISAFGSSARRPKEGDEVRFQIDRGERRTKAINASLKGMPLPDTTTVSYGVGVLWLVVFFLYCLRLIHLPLPLVVYTILSIVTFGFYYVDKKRAEERIWRINSTSLHVLEGLGGWPGALLAMAMLRHLTRKTDHIKMLGAIIAIHLGGWLLWFFRH